MTFDSSTLFARTPAGDAELSLPALGLALGQRRVLTLLQNPSTADELARKFHLEPAKLERDLARLTELRLVQLHGATTVAPREPASAMTPATATALMTPVVIGGSTRRAPARALTAGTLALLVAAGIWYATRSTEPSSRTVPAAVVATLSPTTSAPANVRTGVPTELPTEVPTGGTAAPARANEATSYVGVAATATVLRGNAPPPERRVEIRPGLSPLAVSVPPPAGVALPASAAAPAAAPMAAPGAAPTAAAFTAAVPVPAATATAALPAPAPVSTAAATRAEPPPPVQLAAANPAPVPRPAAPAPVPAPLRAISREQPEFPKEAAADGLKSGTVTARLHVDGRGKVTGVDIVNAQPPRVFDRAVRRALLQWQFEAPASGGNADVDVDIKFQRD